MSTLFTTIELLGCDVDIFHDHDEGYSAGVHQYPHIEVSSFTYGELLSDLELHISIERQLEDIWYGRETPIEN